MQHRTLFFFASAVLAGISCEPYIHQPLAFRATVVVTRAGVPVPDRIVTFQAWKLKEGGGTVTGSFLTGDAFTNGLGKADFVFGYNLEYDEEVKVYREGCRVVAVVNDSGTTCSDTAALDAPFGWLGTECPLETLRVALPPR